MKNITYRYYIACKHVFEWIAFHAINWILKVHAVGKMGSLGPLEMPSNGLNS